MLQGALSWLAQMHQEILQISSFHEHAQLGKPTTCGSPRPKVGKPGYQDMTATVRMPGTARRPHNALTLHNAKYRMRNFVHMDTRPFAPTMHPTDITNHSIEITGRIGSGSNVANNQRRKNKTGLTATRKQ